MDEQPTDGYSKYEIGIAEIDAQHRELFSVLAEMERHWGAGNSHSPQLARGLLSRLAYFAHLHFAIEESLMRMLGYPDIHAHIAEHQRFRKQLDDFQRRLQDADIATELHDFLAAWVKNHIDVTDRRYVPHFLASKIDPKGK